MSTSHPDAARSGAPVPPPEPDLPSPGPLRFYGTTWVERTGGYGLRRAGLAAGSALLAAAGGLVLWLGYAGLVGSETAGWLRFLVMAAFVICSVMAFLRTWGGYAVPREGARADESAFRSIKAVGFVGVLLAYALRTLVEAPGERLARAEHEAALERHRRTIAKRSGNPARRRSPGRTGSRSARRRG
ncbi:hypothetical protein RM780_18320 [Streptomyces sp. DSM 44917]|uniref:Integral membrane protein n=1 Tax=Streptomyces boetiae TaxID=3075541 RepID=A0ABU2LBE1_9ACTN|nr:hypothetical protein [Streptomyces sp. DSM 44917]MDT0308901.1 hypothetical protein [Streptomyces sp. DSM 44917]